MVKRGENLFRIGKAYGIPFDELAKINRISNPHRIQAGRRVFIPGATRRLRVDIITPSSAKVETRPKAGQRRRKKHSGFIWPIKGRLTSRFGPRQKSFHDGIDLAAPSGTPIRASKKGQVIYSDKLRGYGNLIIIRHPKGLASVYAHNRKNFTKEGQRVTQGQVIAEVGITGRVTGPHLHFEIRKNNVAENPLYYLP